MPQIDIDKPRYDQNTYTGRAKHFFKTTNPLNILVSGTRLNKAKELVERYRKNGSLPDGVTEEQLWKAKTLYDSAFHPDTGAKMNIIGRMSAQVPMNMTITGGMMTFYKSTPAVIFWQWINQSFNALVNYTNRSGDSASTNPQIMLSYVGATTGAVVTALWLNKLAKTSPPLVGRFVPFCAVAAANCINIPIMRSKELREGIPIFDNSNNKLGRSRKAAQEGIAQVVISRIIMAVPSMVSTPLFVNYLEKRGILRAHPWLNLPATVLFTGFCLTFATPLACALFKQKAQIGFAKLEPELKVALEQKYGQKDALHYVYYNKGL